MTINNAAILAVLSAGIIASGGCVHKAVKPEDAVAAHDTKASGGADAKRFQDIMDMLYKMKPPAREPESVLAPDNGLFAPVPAKTDKAADTPKAEPHQENGDQK